MATTQITNVTPLGYAPNGQLMFTWIEGNVRYAEYWEASNGTIRCKELM